VDNSRKTRRRLAVTVLGIICIVGLFVGRLIDIQVVNAEELNAESFDKRSITSTDYAARGNIVDTNGVVLAGSVDRYDITASPRAVGLTFDRKGEDGKKVKIPFEQGIAELAEATGESTEDLIASVKSDTKSNFVFLSKSRTLDVLLKVQALKIPWVYSQLRPSRTYPNGAVAGNLVGFIGTDGPQAGLELAQNQCVASKNGTSVFERSPDGVRIPGSTVTTKKAKPGGTLRLTIDSDFQWYVTEVIAKRAKELGAKWATAAVVRVKDAHIMAMADYPTVDPNNVSGAKRTALGSLAFTTPYEPGSTMKPLTAASLIDAGKITQTTHVETPSILAVDGGGTIKDSFTHGTIRYTTAGVITNSSNIGISLLSKKLSKAERRDYLVKFGLDKKTDVNFLYEANGNVPEVEDWDSITRYAVAFGQGMTTTTAQVASAYQALGNDGVRLPLTLVEGCEWPDGTVTDAPKTEGVRVVSKSAANQTVQMMENVVTQGWLANELQIPGYRVAAKTGTAQVAEKGRYGDNYVISVAGMVPAENPEYVVILTFGEPDTLKTSGAAAPTFKKIMTQVIKTFTVTPSTKAAPTIPQTY
jgi:cell division protein FtsI (penicillin-binding protein 3)